MATVRITVDGNTVMDAQVTLTTGDLPPLDQIRQSLTPANGSFQPWSATVVGALGAELLLAKAKGTMPDIGIDVETSETGWAVTVRRG